jgi:hypothetical protein
MITVRQIERLWAAKFYEKLFRELMANRPEESFHYEIELNNAVPAAALAIVRLDELSQSHHPIYQQLVRTLLARQDADGGWMDPMTTALAVKALMCGQGNGLAIDRGLVYLAGLQREEGIWPNIPLRRMPGDAAASAFILYLLGDSERFRGAVRIFEALNWFETHESTLDAQTRRLWERAAVRCRLLAPVERRQAVIWS